MKRRSFFGAIAAAFGGAGVVKAVEPSVSSVSAREIKSGYLNICGTRTMYATDLSAVYWNVSPPLGEPGTSEKQITVNWKHPIHPDGKNILEAGE